MTRYFTLLALLCLSAAVMAQSISTYHITQGDGVPYGYNDDFFKRSDGRLWVGSDLGIYEYDGRECIHIPPGLPTGPYGGMMLSDFYETQDGDIVFSTGQGINLYSSNSNSFQELDFQVSDSSLVNKIFLVDMMSDSEGIARLGDSLYRIDISSMSATGICPSGGVQYASRHLATGETLVLSCPWIISPGIELVRIDSSGGATVIKIDFFQSTGVDDVTCSQAMFLSDSIALCFTSIGPIEVSLSNYESRPLVVNPKERVKAIFGDFTYDSTQILFSTIGNGINSYDIESGEVATLEQVNEQLISLNVREVYPFADDFFWVSYAHEIGLTLVHTSDNRITDVSISDKSIRDLDIVDESWYALTDDGIYQAPEAKRIVNLQGNDINDMSCCDHGWIVAGSQHFDHIGRDGDKKRYDINESILSHACLPDGVLMITASGINKYDVERDTTLDLVIPSVSNSVLNFSKMRVHEDLLFLVYNDVELLIMSLADDDELRMINRVALEHGILSMDILDQDLWLGTTNGLRRYDWVEDSISATKYLPDFGKDHYIQDVTCVSNHVVSLTREGVLVYDIDSDKWERYSEADGIINTTALNSSVTSDENGYVLIANQDELQYFHIDSIYPVEYIPDLTIIDKINNTKWGTSLPDSSQCISISPNQSVLELDFDMIAYHGAKHAEVQYRISGYEDDWVSLGSGGRLSIKLPAGSFTLEAVAVNANGIRGDIIRIPIYVSAPLWHLWYFWLATLLLSGGIVAVGVRYYYRRKFNAYLKEIRRQQEIKDRLNDERNRIAGEMHDELGGGLTSIKLLSNGILSKEGYYDEGKLKRIEKYAGDLVDSMRSIIWSMNDEYNTLGETVIYLKHYLQSTLEIHGIDLVFDIDPAIGSQDVSIEKRRNIFLVIKECAHNVLKHSKATEVSFVAKLLGDYVVLSIRDNGVGIAVDEVKKYSYGIKNMKRRIEEVTGEIDITNHNGTSITIKIPRDE